MKQRYEKLDEIRGIALISMILYHGCWDAVHVLGFNWPWYGSSLSYIWQQSICWTFILLSGFCWQLGKRRLQRGLMVFGGGLLVTAVTLVVLPESRIVFGILTLIGSCMLILIPLDRGLSYMASRADARAGMVISAGVGVSIGLFLATRNINSGWLGFEKINLIQLPESWYANGLTTYLGFPAPGFFSTDYFSLVPWIFLFLVGYFLFSLVKRAGRLDVLGRELESASAESPRFVPECMPAEDPHFVQRRLNPLMDGVRWMGRHSLLVYLVHQPLLYALCMIYQIVFV